MRLAICVAALLLLAACGSPGSYGPGGKPSTAESVNPADGGVGGTGAPASRPEEEEKDGGCGGTGCSTD